MQQPFSFKSKTLSPPFYEAFRKFAAIKIQAILFTNYLNTSFFIILRLYIVINLTIKIKLKYEN